MKIMQIYSNSSEFKSVKFNEQFNVVLGDIRHKNDLTKDSHNLGKSTLIELIDFMLLKTIDKKHFLKKEAFKSHVFFLELKLNRGGYTTIKRAVQYNTKISIKLHDAPYQDYRNAFEWDYLDLRINATAKEENPIYVLNNLLSFDVVPDRTYRKTLSYFFRTQNDYSDVFKLNKFKGKDSDWKPILFELLGFNSEHMALKYEQDAECEQKEILIAQLEKEFKVSEEDVDKLSGLIDIKKSDRDKIVEWLDDFDFYAQDNKIESDTINVIEESVSKLNNEKYDIDYEIAEIDKSLKENIPYKFEDIKKLYEDCQIYLPDLLVKEYDQLLVFNQKVFSERKKYLTEALATKKKRSSEIDKELQLLNNKRQVNMSAFTASNTFKKYNAYRDELINVEREIAQYTTELENVDILKKLHSELAKVKDNRTKTVETLKAQIEESNRIYKSIRTDFHDYVKRIINQDGLISISVNQLGNVEFKDSIVDNEQKDTAQNAGHTYKKIMCACFDLSLIKNYSNASYYRTVYHDGSLESLDPRKQKQYLDLVREISKEYDIQYILTAIKSDIPDDEDSRYIAKESDIAVTLSDENDGERLFGFSF